MKGRNRRLSLYPAPSASRIPSRVIVLGILPPTRGSPKAGRLCRSLFPRCQCGAKIPLSARRKAGRAAPGARRRPGWPRTGSKRKRKAVGNESATPASTFLSPAALSPSGEGTTGPDPLYPYNGNVTEEGENQYLLTSFSGEKEELNPFFISEGSWFVGWSSIGEGANPGGCPFTRRRRRS